MKNKTFIISIIIIFCLLVGVSYLIYKTYDIFGFWTLVWTGLVSIISNFSIGHFFGSRRESNGVITYNPKELPKFLNILVSIAIGYDLYTKIDVPNISKYDYIFGMTYLILLTAIPIISIIYKLIRDRNDFIVIDEDNLKFRDNDDIGDLKFADIAHVELSGGIKLTLKDSKVVAIKTGRMNFNGKDLIDVFGEIKAKIAVNEISSSQK